ncbi:MAG TPA: GNAT family N-acetyltransferase [Caulobacteraceae bacterium]|nr:GNAT family N-acetyltransferase [Caulobacteraceae bacterium]
MDPGHPLDRPVWGALTTLQADLSLGGASALRFAPEYGVFAATADLSPASLAALARLCGPGERLALFEIDRRSAPPGLTVIDRGVCWQMVAETLAAGGIDAAITPMTEDDAPEMLALATLTNPGPFFARTHRLGDFIGVRREGVLVAMAGERMKLPGFTEVSALCTHPDHRGRGLAGALIRAAAARILARGETPFLHVLGHNSPAIALYRILGFSLRREMALTILAPA